MDFIDIRRLKLNEHSGVTLPFSRRIDSYCVNSSVIIAQENHSILLDGDDFDRSEIHLVVQFNQRSQLLQRSMTTDGILKETIVTIRTIVMIDLVEILRETNIDVETDEGSN